MAVLHTYLIAQPASEAECCRMCTATLCRICARRLTTVARRRGSSLPASSDVSAVTVASASRAASALSSAPHASADIASSCSELLDIGRSRRVGARSLARHWEFISERLLVFMYRYCFTVDGRRMLYDVKRISFCPSRYWPTVGRSQWPLAVGGRLSTGHLSFVRSMRQRLPRSMPGQRPGTVGRGPPPPQSEHRRQSISSLRSLRFAAWSLAVPLAGGPERSASSVLRLRHRQPSASGARLAPAPCSTRGPS